MASYFEQRAKELGLNVPASGQSSSGSYFQQRAQELGLNNPPPTQTPQGSDFFSQRSMELGLTPPQMPDRINVMDVRQSPLAQQAAQFTPPMANQSLPTAPPDDRNPVTRTLDYIFKENPVARVINRPFAAAAQSLIPDAPMIKDGQAIPGTSARQQFAERNPIASTGSEALDKGLDVAGNIGSYFMNPSGQGQNIANLYNAVAPLAQNISARVAQRLPDAGMRLSKDGTRIVDNMLSRGVQEGTREALAAATYAVPRSLIQGESDPLDIAKNVAMEGALGAVTGAAAPYAGDLLSRATQPIRDRFRPQVDDFTPPVSQAPASATPEHRLEIPREPDARAEAAAAAFRSNDITPPTRGSQLPEGVQAMQSPTIPLREPNPNANITKPITRQQLLDSVRKNMGVTVRTGRLGVGDEGVLGYYKINPEVVRSRQHGDIQVIAHEVGHHLDKQYKLSNPQFDGELLSLGRATSGPGYTPEQVRNEGLAEYMRLYLTDPQTARQVAPGFTSHLENVLPRKTMNNLSKVQNDIATWIDQGPELQFRGQINRTGRDTKKTVSQRVDDAYTSFMDRFHPLAEVEKMANRIRTGKATLGDASNSLYKRARLSVGAPKKAQEVLQDLKGILRPIDQFGYTTKDLGDFAAAKHALELENLNIESGFTRKQIESVLRKYDTPEMNALQRQLVEYNNSLLEMLVDGQVISREAVDAMKERYPDYVPFYRFFDDDVSAGFGGKGFTDLTNPVKRLKGSTRDIIDPLESIVKNTFAVVNAVEKNKVGLELSKLADVPGMGGMVERLTGKQSVPKENIVTVFEHGEKVQYQLDPELFRAIKQLDEDSTNKLIKFLSFPTSTLRAGATLTPEFALRNPIRDQFQAYVVSNFGYNPIIDLPRGIFHVLRRDDIYRKWAMEGGGYGNYLSQDRNYLREQLKSLKDEKNPWAKATTAITSPKQWIKVLQAMSEVTEEATKVGEFSRGLRKGYSPAEAAFQSRDLMDFGRAGNNIKQLNRVVAFFNANIQGKDRIARAFAKNPYRTTIRALTSITLPTIGIYMWNKHQSNEEQRKTLDNAPQWMRDTFFLISIPGTNEVARIPKPFDLAPIYANLPENIMRWIDDNDPQSAGEFTAGAAEELLGVPYMLTGLTPIIENTANYSFFTKGPIVPQRDQGLLPEDQYGINTSLTARTIGQATGTSPYKIDNLIRGYGAGLGRYATSGIDKLIEAAGGPKIPPQPEKRFAEKPIINAFTVSSSGGGKVMEDFYDELDKINRKDKSNKRNNKSDAEVARSAKGMQATSRSISQIRNRYREIQASFDLTPAEKRRQLDELNDQMNQLAREALERFELKK
ncbi:LPD38 domain-containing protein [Paenibacillus senegalensis]|uniref:LPD38 domain-containing protein n=1 Tax=Paenibacillus senegalensis TaxID=1465766 RepID=UPI00028A2F1E|nr:LPD38 domain-containing protein [Paenibacillus senegalensis]